METMKIGIEKFRYGRDGEWDSWKYQAFEQPNKFLSPALSNSFESLDDLAKYLTEHYDMDDYQLVPYYKLSKSFVSSAAGGIVTQAGTITDEELGELMLCIKKYRVEVKTSEPTEAAVLE